MTNPQQDKAIHFAAIEAASKAVQALSEHWSTVNINVERIDYLGSLCTLSLEKDDPDEEDDDDTRSFTK
jgi:hypothetical protein